MLWSLARSNFSKMWRGVLVAVLLSAATCVQAQDAARERATDDVGTTSAIASHDADLGAGETVTSRAEIRMIIERETARTNLPADIAETVVFVESATTRPSSVAPARSA
jgi:hypothetical protein